VAKQAAEKGKISGRDGARRASPRLPPAGTACRASSSSRTSASGSSPPWSTPVAERGYNATTVANITKAASVSRRTSSNEHFADKEACFLAAYDMVATHIRASDARRGGVVSATGRSRCARHLRRCCASSPPSPSLPASAWSSRFAAGGEIAARYRATMQDFVGILKAGRPEHSGERPLPEATEETSSAASSR